MALSNMVVYNEQIQSKTVELLTQYINLFNAASGGAITLSSELTMGNFTQKAFFSNLAAARRRVDRFAANGTPSVTPLSQKELVGVKVAGGFGPVLFEDAQMTALKMTPADAIMAISESFAAELMQDQLNTAVGAAIAAVEGFAGSALVKDVSATGAITQSALNGSHAKFGDRSQSLICQVMDGQTYHKLIDQNLSTLKELFTNETVTVVQILGKRVVVSDIPALYVAGTPNKSKVLSLTANGIVVKGGNDIVSNLETKNGKDRIETTWQADYTFVIELKGYAWDIANGGKSPLDAEIFTATNWDAVVDKKLTAGVVAIGNADSV